MKSDLRNAEFVESYLNNSLSEEESLDFENGLQTDEEFAEFVSIFTEVDSAIAEQDVIELRNSLGSIYEVMSEEWQEEAPMIVEDSCEDEIDRAVGEEDIMHLRSMLNDIHDLNNEEVIKDKKYEIACDIDPNELSGFLQDLEAAEQYEEYLDEDISAALMEDDVMSLRSKLGDIGKEVSSPVQENKPWYSKISRLTAVASIIILLLIGGTTWVTLDSIPMKPAKAAAKFFVPPEGKGVTRAAVAIEDISLDAAFEKYRLENYSEAALVFEALRGKDPSFQNAPVVNAFLGFSFFMSERYAKASVELSRVIEDNSSVYVDPAEWILAGCMLRDRETEDKGIELLQKIARKPDHEYSELSKLVLKKLKH